MRYLKAWIATIAIFFFIPGCNFEGEKHHADVQFADQHFKTAISLIELYKIRFGEYPDSVGSIKFTGDWDALVWRSIKYEKKDSAYNLDLANEQLAREAALRYPEKFWNGLGLLRSNLKN